MKKGIMAKDKYIGIRTTSEVKQILQKLADEEYRTLSQQCEMLLIQWIKEHGHIKKPSSK